MIVFSAFVGTNNWWCGVCREVGWGNVNVKCSASQINHEMLGVRKQQFSPVRVHVHVRVLR